MANQELPVRRRPGQLGGALIVALAIALGANYLSGATHAIWNWSAEPERPAPYALLQMHGISAVAVQTLLGALIVAHILPAWRARRHIASGLAVAIPLGVLVVSGLGLYYAGNDAIRSLCLWSHIIVGLALPLPLMIHILRRKN